MSKKMICFIAQFPPPMHGLSKAVETLYNSTLAEEFEFEKVDITNNKNFIRNLRLIRKSKADLFYFTISQTKGGNLRDLVILKLLRMQHKKCMIHLHGGYYRQLVDNDLPTWQKNANYKVIGMVDGAIVLGKSLKSIFEGMLPDEKIFIVPNCVDDEYLMSDVELEEKVAKLSNRIIKHVLYLSNCIRSKGYPEVLEIARLEKERCVAGGERKFQFDFAGEFFEKTEEDFFFGFVKDNRLEDYVTYHGIVGGDKKRELLKLCDVFVLLTRYPNEGQPISILEAMGNGMMIVTTDHAGIPDIVEDGVEGVVFGKSQKDMILRAYTAITNADYSEIERNGRELVLNSFIQDIYIANLKKSFNKVLM